MTIKCIEILETVNSMKRLKYPFNNEYIPENGIYILFEKGEYCNGGDRIVRVGTHSGENSLKSRLLHHFNKGVKDRNIFRKNIGRAMLNRDKDKYLEKWDLNLRSKENRIKYLPLIDIEYEKKLEEIISDYIQKNITFILIEENDKDKRLLWEKRLISEISNCNICSPSKDWLGNYSPKEKIRKSGLWQINELYKDGFSNLEYNEFVRKIDETKYKYRY